MKKPRLLVIDDEAAIGNLVAEVAADAGFEAFCAVDAGALGVEQIAAHDLVMLDLLMPGVDGIEVLRSLGSSSKDMQLVLMSGMDQRMLEGARQLAQVKGLRVFDVLRKPFRPAQLRALLDRFVAASPEPAPGRPRSARVLPDVTREELEAAIGGGQLRVHFQPQVALADGEWIGVEALARWEHPRHGLLFPDSFIGLAEGPELALPFTLEVLRISVEQAARLAKEVGFRGKVSVNMPPTALTDVGFPEKVVAILEAGGLGARRTVMEVTETSIPSDPAVSLDIETRLRMRGIDLSIDDFGTGHSSLERLRGAPFDEIKIDMVFVRNADNEPGSRVIVENAIRLGHSLGMRVVAEGVESAASMNWLKSLGCDMAQGYFISRPVAVEGLVQWAQARRRDDAGRAAPAVAQAAELAEPTGRPVLLVDDNQQNRQMFADYLAGHGFDVHVADNGLRAVELASGGGFAAVVMDVQMPELDGVGATRRIRALAGDAGKVPIIMLTATGNAAERRRSIEAGANDFLTKPLRLKELLASIDRVTGAAGQTQAAGGAKQ